MSIEIANESETEVDLGALVAVARFALDAMDVSPMAELSMLLVESKVMAELHERWMDLPGPTDVMAFPMDDAEDGRRPDAPGPGPALLGDVVLCPSFAAEQARAAGHRLLDELRLLTVHGVLHLLGFDHGEPDEEREMFGLQNKILNNYRAAMRETERRAALRAADNRVLGTAGLEPDDLDGNGNGNGTGGNGTDGNGTDGNGTDGNGTDGNGTDDGRDPDGRDPDGGGPDGGGPDGTGPDADGRGGPDRSAGEPGRAGSRANGRTRAAGPPGRPGDPGASGAPGRPTGGG